MYTFLNWLSKESKGLIMVLLIVICVILMFVCSFSAVIFIEGYFNVTLPRVEENSIMLDSIFPLVILLTALIEEFSFRFIPLSRAFNRWGLSYKVIVVALISSAIFGWLHGSYINIAIQGVSGFLLSLLFLKCGGFQKKYLKAFMVSSSAHCMFLLTLYTLRILHYRYGLI